ncbi:hypothetical protein VUR80DRAFT_5982 [Thermomyces stellatus]
MTRGRAGASSWLKKKTNLHGGLGAERTSSKGRGQPHRSIPSSSRAGRDDDEAHPQLTSTFRRTLPWAPPLPLFPDPRPGERPGVMTGVRDAGSGRPKDRSKSGKAAIWEQKNRNMKPREGETRDVGRDRALRRALQRLWEVGGRGPQESIAPAHTRASHGRAPKNSPW